MSRARWFSPATSLAVLTASVVSSVAFPALAQTASQVTRDDYAPPVSREAEGELVAPEPERREAPEGAEALTVTPSGLEIEGGLPDLADAAGALAVRIEGKPVSAADLFALAHDLETAYARAGYLLARVSLPPQTIRDGAPLKLVVTDGYVSAIDLSALPERARPRVRTLLTPLIGERWLTRQEIERRLLLAGDTPGVRLNSALRAGDAPGSTVLVVGGDYRPVAGSAAFNNSLSDAFGSYAVNLSMDLNNLAGAGEVGYAYLGGDPGDMFSSDPRNRQMVVGVTAPLGASGFWGGLEGVDSRTHPTIDLGYDLRDHFQRLTLRGGYHIKRSRNLNASSVLSLDLANETEVLDLGGGVRQDFFRDQLRVLRLSVTGDAYSSTGGRFAGGVTASFGLDALGARQPSTVRPMSRDGADPEFQKLEASLRYSRALGDVAQLSFSGRAQTSFGDPLAASEQMALGGMDWLSAFDAGSISADTGAAARGDITFPGLFRLQSKGATVGAVITPYVFLAGGVAELERPTAVEAATVRAGSVGAGLYVSLPRRESSQDALLRFEFAHGNTSDDDAEDSFRIALSVGL